RGRGLRGRTRRGASLAKPRHAIDEGGLAFFHLGDGAPQGGTHLAAVFNGALGVPAHAAGQAGEVDGGAAHVHAYVGALGWRAAHASHADLVLPIVVVGAIVE